MVDDAGRKVIAFPEGPLSDGMAEAADMNLGLPMALVWEALDEAFGSLDSDSPSYLGAKVAEMRLTFETHLHDVVKRYQDGFYTGY